MPIRTYRDLEVFQESYAAALAVSKLARSFPPLEQPELGRQLRKAARSIPANVVEGWAKRRSTAEFKRYLQVAIGSCDEVKLWLEMGKDEGYIPDEFQKQLVQRYNRIGVMLASLWKVWQRAIAEMVLSLPLCFHVSLLPSICRSTFHRGGIFSCLLNER